MNGNDYEERRQYYREKRRKAVRRRKICICIIVIVALIAIVAILVIGGRKKEDLTAAGQNEVADVLPSEAEIAEETAPESTEEPEAEPTVEPVAEVIPDRSNFAVQPGVPCGSDEMSGEKVVYLTLDDGPSELTAQVLDICDRYGIKITFFVTGQNPEYRNLIKEAYDRGHTIGLHTYSHDYAYIYSSVDNYFADLDAIGQVVKEQIGYVPCFVRFPGGASNEISADYCPGIMSALTQELPARGYQYYDWNCSSGDGGSCTNPEELATVATSCAETNIVLLSHDGVSHEPTIEALPYIIEDYLSYGYTFKGLDRESYTSHHSVRN